MIVVAIIGILAAIAIPSFAAYRTKAFNASAQGDLRNAMTAEEAYYSSSAQYFSIVKRGGGFGTRNFTLGISVSKQVTLSMSRVSTSDDYTGTTRHALGNLTYRVTGTVGIIREN